MAGFCPGKDIDKSTNQYIDVQDVEKGDLSVFGIGMQELIIIVIIALLIVGPKKLPDMAKSLGKGLNEFRRAAEGLTEDIKETIKVDDEKKPEDPLNGSRQVKKNDS
ncbi:MAG TPA: twin-arginine translocase TatA/TatE family subunit [Smithella sp.]|nr:twin-arginine translocase TatA/TatE family subunit [Smithella sp.]HRS97727.1 twin-arginine translocase TatA/TatE family subunit [Smithella sp.]